MNQQFWRLIKCRGAFFCCSAVVATVLTLTAIALWFFHRTDLQMRESLLQQTKLVLKSVNIESVKVLSGSASDVDKPEYRVLKEQLSSLRKANAKYRFVYLMGRKADGTIFFFLDADTDNPASPGTIYTKASEEFRCLFDSGNAFVEGPLSDEWGVWVSAAVPVIDPSTGKVLAIFGMDCDAGDWRWEIIKKAAWPSGLALIVFSGIIVSVLFLRREESKSKPVLARLMLPLTTAFFLLTGGGIALLIMQHKDELDQSSQQMLKDGIDDLSFAISQRYKTMSAIEESLGKSHVLIKALKARDTQALMERFGSLYEQLSASHGISHFYLMDEKMNIVLRVYNPQERGGVNTRFTAREAARTGKTVCGIEAGARGTITLRTVRPVWDAANTIGYIELGVEINRLLEDIHADSGLETALLIRKSALNREAWEKTLVARKQTPAWDRFPDEVLTYASLPLSTDVDALVKDVRSFMGEVPMEMLIGGKSWRVMASPLINAAGIDIGNILIFHDITAVKQAHAQVIQFAVAGGALILFSLWSGLYFILRRTDTGICRQIEMIREGEERYHVLFSDSPDAYLILSDTIHTACNHAACALFRCAPAQITGKRIGSFSPEFQPDGQRSSTALQGHIQQAISSGRHSFEWLALRSDGTKFWCEIVISPIVVHGEQMLFLSLRDITEKKNAQEQLLQSERMAAVGILAAGVAHNFNNLHAGILGHLKLLRQKEELSDAGKKKLEVIAKTVDRAVELTNNILIMSGKRQDRRSLHRIDILLNESMDIVRNEFEADGIHIEMQLDDHTAACCYGGEICHVILNLLINARHAMIGLAVKTLTITCGREGNWAYFSITDTGCGISEETRKNMFTPFFSTKGVYAQPGSALAGVTGTGLGLCSSRTIIDNHCGEIEVESVVGHGSKFTVKLPVACDQAE